MMRLSKNNKDINFNDLPADIKDYIFKMNRPYHSKINQEYKDNKFRYECVISDIMFVHMWSNTPTEMLGYIEDVNLDMFEEDAEDSIYFITFI